MVLRFTTNSVRNGWAAIAGGVLLMLSFGIELVHPVQEPDGTVLDPVTSAVVIAMWGLGMLCFAATVFHVRALHQEAETPLSRAGRAGVRLAVAGSTLHVLFAIMVGITVVVTDKPWEASFVLFALGFLLLVVGGVLLGFGVRRAAALRAAAAPFWVGAAAAFAAIAVFTDPWHDAALAVYASTWIALGTVLRRDGRSSVATTRAHLVRATSNRVSGQRGVSQPFQAIRRPHPR
jgi:hypothetical protein